MAKALQRSVLRSFFLFLITELSSQKLGGRNIRPFHLHASMVCCRLEADFTAGFHVHQHRAMSNETSGNKKRGREGSNPAIAPPSNSEPCLPEADLDLSNDIKGILAVLQQVRDKAKNDGQKRNEEIINSVAAEVKAMVDDLKTKADKERQNLIKAATKICKECESALKDESNRYQSIYEKFCKEKASHLQAYEETFLKFEDGKEKLLGRYEQQRKKEKAAVLELQKIRCEKISAIEEIIRLEADFTAGC